jgi:murein DD-endopeptidase MepM/ murein hydrolase activator NlpD
VPRISVYIMSLLVLAPIILLFYFVNINIQQQKENDQLSANLNIQTSKVNGLQEKVSSMEDKTTEVQSKLQQLTKLESQMREYLTELPGNLGSSGGINIPISDTKGEQSKEGASNPNIQSAELIERYKETIAEIEKASNKLKRTPSIWPTNSHTITSAFGIRSDPLTRASSFHTGIDIAGATGNPVYAGADGTVTLAGNFGGYGNAIIIRHSSTYKTLYGHLSEIKVNQGDAVKKGSIIGSVGSTGRSTGPHLHYEIIKSGEPIDPYKYLNFFNDNKE